MPCELNGEMRTSRWTPCSERSRPYACRPFTMKLAELIPASVPGDTSSSSTSSVAVEAAAEFFRSSSRSDREATSFLDRVYPAQLLYYGKRSSKAYVMAEKRAFLDRWPKRAYAVRPGSVSTSCDPRNNLCTVSGIVDWRVSSLERNVISTGSAKFQLTFSMGAELTLLSEWSEVITRHAGP